MRLPIFVLALLISSCGVNWFPKCDEPNNKCPPLAPSEDPTPYPPGTPFHRTTDAGSDAW